MSIKSLFENIADAIKDKNPNVTNVTPVEMPSAIRDIPTGSSTAVGVTYDNTASGLTANNVQGAIDELAGNVSAITSDLSELTKSSFGDSINITSYTSTAYICPSDGYVKIYAEGTTVGNKVQLEINGISAACTVRCLIANYADSASVFVKKGMQLKVSVINGYAIFYPLA